MHDSVCLVFFFWVRYSLFLGQAHCWRRKKFISQHLPAWAEASEEVQCWYLERKENQDFFFSGSRYATTNDAPSEYQENPTNYSWIGTKISKSGHASLHSPLS